MKPAPAPSRFASSALIAAGVAGGLLIGFLAGKSLHPTAPEPPSSSSVTAPARPARDGAPAASTAAPPSAATALENAAREAQAATPQEPRDPIAKLRASGASSSQFGRVIRAFNITSQLSAEEIPAVLAYAKTMAGEESEIVMIGALARWAELDPAATAEWTRTQTQTGGSGRGSTGEMLQHSVAEWAAIDANAARAWADGLTDKDQRETALRGYLTGLATRDPALALSELQKIPGGNTERTYAALFTNWAGQDPRAAALAAASLTDNSSRAAALQAVGQSWGKEAPAEAVGWALQLSNKDDQRRLTRDLLSAWAAREPQAAMARLLSLPADLRDEAARSVVESAARGNFEEARRFVEQLPPGAGRDQATAVVTSNWAARDPQAAADFARSLPPGPAQDEAWRNIARTWGQREPAAAAQWIAQLPEGAARANAARQVVDRWTKADPQAVAQWMERLPAGPTRDSAAMSFASEVRTADPVAAMEWVGTVANVNQREQAVRQVLEAWRKKDQAAANAWLQQTNMIGPDLRSVLLRTP